jgi:translation initiation factor IF-3
MALNEDTTELNPEIAQTARTLIGQYGDDAAVIATLRAAELAATGNVDGLFFWDSVIELIEDMAEGKVPQDA